MSKRKIHPNSLKALEEATEKRSKPTGKRVNVFLTERAIASLDRIAKPLGISRSELMERIARAGDEAIMGLLSDRPVSLEKPDIAAINGCER